MKFSRTWAIARKEWFHIFRDWRSLGLVILMPVLLMLLFGYAVTLDVKKVPMGVLDRDKSQESLSFIHRFSASPYFRLRFFAQDEKEMNRLIDRGEVKMGLVLPYDFSRTVKAGRKAGVQVLLHSSRKKEEDEIFSYLGDRPKRMVSYLPRLEKPGVGYPDAGPVNAPVRLCSHPGCEEGADGSFRPG